jgi:hypothetical protein
LGVRSHRMFGSHWLSLADHLLIRISICDFTCESVASDLKRVDCRSRETLDAEESYGDLY